MIAIRESIKGETLELLTSEYIPDTKTIFIFAPSAIRGSIRHKETTIIIVRPIFVVRNNYDNIYDEHNTNFSFGEKSMN